MSHTDGSLNGEESHRPSYLNDFYEMEVNGGNLFLFLSHILKSYFYITLAFPPLLQTTNAAHYRRTLICTLSFAMLQVILRAREAEMQFLRQEAQSLKEELKIARMVQRFYWILQL